MNASGDTMTGALSISKDAAAVQTLNRTTSNGDIQVFQKDGTTVGSIGVNSGWPHFSRSSHNTGLALGGADIFPVNTAGAVNDNAIDLGAGSARWKNLYLSGGVYLGGTGSANYLDDYEEGTWDCTPSTSTLSNSPLSGWTINTAAGFYTKVGQLVTLSYIFEWSNTTTDGSKIYMNLPFPVKGSNCWTGTGTEVSKPVFPTGTTYVTVRPEQNGTHASFKACGSGIDRIDMKFNHFGVNAGGYALGTFSYFTSA